MKIMLAGDLHFNKIQFQWLEEQKNSYDCLCLTGDFLDSGSADFSEQSVWVSNWMKALDKQLFVCSGNHDLDEVAESDWLIKLRSSKICRDNQKKNFNGIVFGCMPYLGADLSYFSDCNVLLTHVPPMKTATAKSVVDGKLRDWGDDGLYYAVMDRVITPQYILCGHVENPSANRDQLCGVEILNPGAEHNSTVPRHKVIIV